MTTLTTPSARPATGKAHATSATPAPAPRASAIRIVLKLALAAFLSFVLLVFSSSKVDFVYTGF